MEEITREMSTADQFQPQQKTDEVAKTSKKRHADDNRMEVLVELSSVVLSLKTTSIDE